MMAWQAGGTEKGEFHTVHVCIMASSVEPQEVKQGKVTAPTLVWTLGWGFDLKEQTVGQM